MNLLGVGLAVLGAVVGVGTGNADLALLTALPMRLVNLLESDLLQAVPLYVFIGGPLNGLPIADAFFRSTVRLVRGSSVSTSVEI